jgi:hypothetical protein
MAHILAPKIAYRIKDENDPDGNEEYHCRVMADDHGVLFSCGLLRTREELTSDMIRDIDPKTLCQHCFGPYLVRVTDEAPLVERRQRTATPDEPEYKARRLDDEEPWEIQAKQKRKHKIAGAITLVAILGISWLLVDNSGVRFGKEISTTVKAPVQQQAEIQQPATAQKPPVTTEHIPVAATKETLAAQTPKVETQSAATDIKLREELLAKQKQEALAAEQKKQEALAAEKKKQKSLAAEQKKQEALAAEKKKQEALAAEQKKQEALAAEKKKQEALAAEQKKQEALAAEQKKQEALAAEQKKQEALAAEQKKQEALAAEQKKQKTLAAEQKKQESLAAEQKKQEALAAEKKKQEALAAEQKKQEAIVATAPSESAPAPAPATATVPSAPPIGFADPMLELCVREALAIDPTAPITHELAATLTELNCSDTGVERLEGLEQLPYLEKLDLSSNSITDMLPVVGLGRLTSLNLKNNQITVIDAVAKLPIQCEINLLLNPIKDITPFIIRSKR